MVTTESHCSDSCNIVASITSTFKEFVPKEQRMEQAIYAIQQGMALREASRKFGIPVTTIHDHLTRVFGSEHPKPQSQPQSQSEQKPIGRSHAIRRFAANNGIKQINGKRVYSCSVAAICEALAAANIELPSELQPQPKKSTSNSPNKNVSNKQRVSTHDRLTILPEGRSQSNSESEHPAFADELDIDAVRQRVNRDIQQSDRPRDFKRAIELLTELDAICTDAWYRRHPEPWGHDDWAHVSSEIEAIHSIVGQRAEETADELLRKSLAVTVESTAVY